MEKVIIIIVIFGKVSSYSFTKNIYIFQYSLLPTKKMSYIYIYFGEILTPKFLSCLQEIVKSIFAKETKNLVNSKTP